jgi:hypothetical protein
MTPILSTVIKSDNGTTDVGRIRAYLDDLIESLPALLPCRYALIDVMALKTDSRVEVYEEAGKDGGRILWLPDTPSAKEAGQDGVRILWLPDTRTAAIAPYDGGEWRWTRASNPQDALRRYRDGRMQP